jgi:threonyl-tRNA synthetase
MFEKNEAPKRVGNKLIFKFNSEEEIMAFQEIIGIGMFIYAIRKKPEFKKILDYVNEVAENQGFKKVFSDFS